VSRVALFYFCFSLVYCIAQIAFQVWAFNINNDAGIRLLDIIDVSGIVADLEAAPLNSQVYTASAFQPQDSVTPTSYLPASISTSTTTSTSTRTSTSSKPSALTTSSASTSAKRPPAARPTATPTPRDHDEDNNVRRLTKRKDGLIRVNDDNVSGVLVPDLVVDGELGAFLTDACVKLLMEPAGT
jgi:hypothetical protein